MVNRKQRKKSKLRNETFLSQSATQCYKTTNDGMLFRVYTKTSKCSNHNNNNEINVRWRVCRGKQPTRCIVPIVIRQSTRNIEVFMCVILIRYSLSLEMNHIFSIWIECLFWNRQSFWFCSSVLLLSLFMFNFSLVYFGWCHTAQ